MARTFLSYTQVSSKEELKGRIEKGIAEWNEHPVIFRWSNFNLGTVFQQLPYTLAFL
jgi:hypothetical protein